MALPTQGFSVRALPTAPTIPGNVGVVQPLDPARVAQLAMQLRAAAQNESIRNQEAMNADNAARQNLVLSRAAESRKQQAFPLEQQSATLENQGRAQNIAQGAESFTTAAPQRALLAKQAQYEGGLVGPSDVSENYEKNPDGSFTITQTEKRNGQVVNQTKKQAYLPPGMTAAMVGFTKGPVLYDANGATVSTLQNRMGDVILANTGEKVDPTKYSSVAPTKAAIAGDVAAAVAPIKTQQAIDTAKGVGGANLSVAREKERPAVEYQLAQMDISTKNVDGMIDRLKAMIGPGTTGYGVLISKLPASDQNTVRQLLESIVANVGFDRLAEMKAASANGASGLGQVSDTEGRLLRSTIAPLGQDLEGRVLIDSLDRLKSYRAATLENLKHKVAATYGDAGAPQSGAGAQAASPPRTITAEEAKTAPNGTYLTPDGRTITINR